MDKQGQGWLRGTIIALAIAAAVIYLANRRSGAKEQVAGAAGGVAETAGDTVETVRSSEVGQRGGRITELLLGIVNDQAIRQAKGMLKDLLHRAEDIVDQL